MKKTVRPVQSKDIAIGERIKVENLSKPIKDFLEESNKEQKELLEKFREIENEKSNPSIKKFFQKAKDFWKS